MSRLSYNGVNNIKSGYLVFWFTLMKKKSGKKRKWESKIPDRQKSPQIVVHAKVTDTQTLALPRHLCLEWHIKDSALAILQAQFNYQSPKFHKRTVYLPWMTKKQKQPINKVHFKNCLMILQSHMESSSKSRKKEPQTKHGQRASDRLHPTLTRGFCTNAGTNAKWQIVTFYKHWALSFKTFLKHHTSKKVRTTIMILAINPKNICQRLQW